MSDFETADRLQAQFTQSFLAPLEQQGIGVDPDAQAFLQEQFTQASRRIIEPAGAARAEPVAEAGMAFTQFGEALADAARYRNAESVNLDMAVAAYALAFRFHFWPFSD